ncbi:hypothetical protein EK0264_03490 [Epidermidibacterium keratini]|uniref:SHOCT domain-containing protein n=1 Tax=Epidermidibacterium keratini TaxID=1891644 RepID=A0A7L4YK55_9ACTN|nr:SHOCT domain-containing protein [Epidermidibacterium keratini]QHB99437.1 hypothetical protein EK0264_03490 [Epidermidibacterium keratini]
MTTENASTAPNGSSNDDEALAAQREKLRSLKRQLDDGLITDDEYVARRAQIVDPR